MGNTLNLMIELTLWHTGFWLLLVGSGCPNLGQGPKWSYAFYVFSPVTEEQKIAFALFGFRRKIDPATAGANSRPPRREKIGGETRPSSARIFVPRLRRSMPAEKMPIFAHVDVKKSFLHTLSVTDGKNSFFAHVLGYGRKKIDGPPPPRPRK